MLSLENMHYLFKEVETLKRENDELKLKLKKLEHVKLKG